jgi:hypothetical protein
MHMIAHMHVSFCFCIFLGVETRVQAIVHAFLMFYLSI